MANTGPDVRARVKLPAALDPRTIPAALDRAAVDWPSTTGVVGRVEGRTHPLNFSEYRAGAAAAAVALRSHGVAPGDRVLWLADNDDSATALLAHQGILRMGAIAVPLNPRLAAPEIAAIVERVRPTLMLSAEPHRDLANRALRLVGGPVAHHALGRLDGIGSGNGPDAAVDEDSKAVVLFTSGTTGRPKGVVHTHGSALAAGIGWSDAFRLRPGIDVLQSPFPIFSGAGLHFNALSCLWSGAAYVVDGTDTAASLALIEECGSTVYVAVPAIYQYWLDSGLLNDSDPAFLSSLRILDYGGASMAPTVIERLREALPRAGLMQTYGLTEAGPGGLYLAEEYALTKLGSIGNRAAGATTEFRVVDCRGVDVGADCEGELVLRGASIMAGYWEDDVATSAAFTADGWLRSGDLVRLDGDGFAYHCDRLKDIIVRGGYNIASAEVEAVLMEHHDVVEAAVIGREHPRLGEEVEAIVVLREGSATTTDALQAHCAERLADFKVPRHVRLIDRLPRNAAGKVTKPELRRMTLVESRPGTDES
jgi:acyl-CoA synthetase (AMP-forming)/AMP-acid ligase II